MSFRYGFFNSKNGDRKYFASDFSMIFNGLIEDGVFGNVPDGFPVTSTGGMNIAVGKGLAWFSGTWNYIDALYPLTVASADVLYARIDAVVIEVHNDNTVRTNYVKMVKGTPAAEPVPPSMEVEGYTLHPLAYVTVPAGAESISAENIQSVVGTSECPFVVGIQETASVDQLFVQWQEEFDKWFQDLKDNLDENVAANLQNQITTHVTDKTMHIPTLGYFKEGTVHQLTGLLGVSGLVSCIFTATDDYVDGDTITVDGEQYAVQLSSGDAAGDRLFVSGVTVSVVVDKENKRVNFKAGGGYVKGDVIAAENLKKQSNFKNAEVFSFAYSLPFLSGVYVGTSTPWERKWFTETVDGVPYISVFPEASNKKLKRYSFDGSLISEVAASGASSNYVDVVVRAYNWLVLGKLQTENYYYPRPLRVFKADETGTKFTYLMAPPGEYPDVYNYISYSENAIFGAHTRYYDYRPSSNTLSYYAYKSDGTEIFDITDTGENVSLNDYTCTKEHVIYIVRNQNYPEYHVFVYSITGGLVTSYPLTSAAFYNYEGFTNFTLFRNDMPKCMIGLYKAAGNTEIGSSYRKIIVEFDPVNNKILNTIQPGDIGFSAASFFTVQGSASNWSITNCIKDMSTGKVTRCLVEVDDNWRPIRLLEIPTSGQNYVKDFDYNLTYQNTAYRITYPISISDDQMLYARHDATTQTSYFDYIGDLNYKVLEVSK